MHILRRSVPGVTLTWMRPMLVLRAVAAAVLHAHSEAYLKSKQMLKTSCFTAEPSQLLFFIWLETSNVFFFLGYLNLRFGGVLVEDLTERSELMKQFFWGIDDLRENVHE